MPCTYGAAWTTCYIFVHGDVAAGLAGGHGTSAGPQMEEQVHGCNATPLLTEEYSGHDNWQIAGHFLFLV
jgi:hypothetical protein